MQPAARFGYAFEDDGLVDEMLDAVEGERGALPLLAFAVARFWEERDRERQLLTRQAYADIWRRRRRAGPPRRGDVAAHRQRSGSPSSASSSATSSPPKEPVQFENGMNFCPYSAIRADESPEDVLRELINARLLTSYEICEDDEAPTRRVEIVHESLLTNWPRLVGWQTQDADSARLRDELRQAARSWDEHGRHRDRLWSGAAFREFACGGSGTRAD